MNAARRDDRTPRPPGHRPRRASSVRPGARCSAPGCSSWLLVIAAVWFAGIGPFSRDAGDPGPPAGARPNATPTSPFLPAVTAQPSFLASPGLTAPPVGLRILSPADGAVVGAREVTVIGTAPPGLRITQDVSFGFDRHATADGTGHWAIGIELSEGDNQLKFRIGDDPSTTQTLRRRDLRAPRRPDDQRSRRSNHQVAAPSTSAIQSTDQTMNTSGGGSVA